MIMGPDRNSRLDQVVSLRYAGVEDDDTLNVSDAVFSHPTTLLLQPSLIVIP